MAPRHQGLVAYERELIGLVQAVRHWRPYLWGRQFVVKTYHYSLKFLLDQRLTTIPQHHWVSKLLGFDFSVEYKPGASNVVADALSRHDSYAGPAFSISGPSFDIVRDMCAAATSDLAPVALLDQVTAGTLGHRGPWWMGSSSTMASSICHLIHHCCRLPSPVHMMPLMRTLRNHCVGSGATSTLLRNAWWCRSSSAIVPSVSANKMDHLHLAGLLQPLPVPTSVWSDISMDFVEGLPKFGGKSVILTIVDRFSKYAHFIALSHPYSAESVAAAIICEVVRFHGVPTSIVSDRDPEGDLIAYRLVELSSSLCPELSSYRIYFTLLFQVGKILIYDPISLRIILLPVPEYPVITGENKPKDESDTSMDFSPYKEDGSLEIEYSSLLDVRLLKGVEPVPGALSTPAEIGKGGSIAGKPVTVDKNGGNIDYEKHSLVANKTKDQAILEEMESTLWEENGQPNYKTDVQENGWGTWKRNASTSAWSYRALSSRALGPTMAILRGKNNQKGKPSNRKYGK
ncbi:hypothetical protein U9M48_035992 [Paspalum notatum var. saurae]|uniref:Integrase catalytic domain-containing protein n=1 Tax=Paspalum notatum var. saurae TaxID=547442 RepID=A0AAQ3UC90_PASNO